MNPPSPEPAASGRGRPSRRQGTLGARVAQRGDGDESAFARGELWTRVVARAARALGTGALQPIATRRESLRDAGVDFQVRVVDALAHKDRLGEAAPSERNPFLPYEPDLFVAELSDSHVCLLSKFNVLEGHLLLVTRFFEPQEALLTRADFRAAWTGLSEIEGLVFYNAGRRAGASQPHKHLQLVPLPLGDGGDATPLDPVLAGAEPAPAPRRATGLPFAHAWVRVDDLAGRPPAAAAEAAHERYRALLSEIGVGGTTHPYNLLFTREWMLAVPRRRESCEGVPVNAVGFCGALLVRDAEQLDFVRRRGPMSILRDVAAPASGP